MQEPAKKEKLQPTPELSLRSFLKLKSTWVVIIGALMMAISPLLDWATATISVPPLIYGYAITITGHDATWNLTFGPQGILRMVYFQLTSLGLAVLALLLRIFFPSQTPKSVRTTMLMISGILGVMVPTGFIYVGISEAQQLTSQLQQVIDFLKILNILQYNFSAGSGLILAIAGPVLLLIGGIIVFREKK